MINPKLSEFCKNLTGIDQNTVDRSDIFENVLKHFESWMSKHGLGITKTFILITDGPFDMGRFMYLQCKYSKISFPEYGMYWANLRKLFVNFYKNSFYANNNHSMQLPGLQTMLSRLGKFFLKAYYYKKVAVMALSTHGGNIKFEFGRPAQLCLYSSAS